MVIVSIIIPTYNRERLLSSAIESVIKQSYKDWELIIVDDMSIDGTKALVENYIKKDKRIRYVKNMHKKGPGGARNQGIEISNGEYIAFLDSDDIWKKEHLSECIWLFANSDVDLVFAKHRILDMGSGKERGSANEYRRFTTPHKEIKKGFVVYKNNILPDLVEANFMHTSSVVLRKGRIRFDENINIGEDWDYWIRSAKSGACIGYIDEVHEILRVHGDNIASNEKNEIRSIDEYIKLYRKLSKAIREYRSFFLHRLSKNYLYKAYYLRKRDRLKALLYCLKSLWYRYDPKQLVYIRKLLTGYYT